MKFNDTADGLGLIQDCEDLTNLGAAGISGSTALMKTFTRWINAWNHKVSTIILKSQDNWDFDDSNKSTYPVLTTNLVASQQDYILPTGTLKLKRVKLAADGTNWYWAEPIDSDEATGGTTATTFSTNEDASKPKYDVVGNSIFIYPTPTANRTSCLKIWIAREMDEFTTASTTTEPGFDEPFHRMLSLGASYDYAVQHTLPNANLIRQTLNDYELKLESYFRLKLKDKVNRMVPAKQDNH